MMSNAGALTSVLLWSTMQTALLTAGESKSTFQGCERWILVQQSVLIIQNTGVLPLVQLFKAFEYMIVNSFAIQIAFASPKPWTQLAQIQQIK